MSTILHLTDRQENKTSITLQEFFIGLLDGGFQDSQKTLDLSNRLTTRQLLLAQPPLIRLLAQTLLEGKIPGKTIADLLDVLWIYLGDFDILGDLEKDCVKAAVCWLGRSGLWIVGDVWLFSGSYSGFAEFEQRNGQAKFDLLFKRQSSDLALVDYGLSLNRLSDFALMPR